jgi:signal peptide peptidase SppA
MKSDYARVASFALEFPWAVTRPMVSVIATILAERLGGVPRDPDAIAAAIASRSPAAPAPPPMIGVLSVHGILCPRFNMFSAASGGSSFDLLSAELRLLVADKRVHTIVLDVDSPGGSVAGATEFAAEVRKAAKTKPVIAQAAHLMASAAYWVASGATEIVATPSAMVGSIGVFGIHDDISDALEKLGVKRDVIAAGKFKTDGVGGLPLSVEGRKRMQRTVDEMYAMFVGDVAAGRGVSVEQVRSGYGEGATVTAATALQCGMVDRIGTISETLARAQGGLTTGSPRLTAQRAEETRSALAPYRMQLLRAQLATHQPRASSSMGQ